MISASNAIVRYSCRLVFLIFWSITTILWSPTSARAQTILKVGLPRDDPKLLVSYQTLAERIQEESNGSLELRLFYDHDINSTELMRAVTQGRFDLAPIFSEALDNSDLIPGLNKSFLLEGPHQIMAALNKESVRLKEQFGIQYLSTTYLGTYAMVGSVPLNDAAALDGKRIASTSDLSEFGITTEMVAEYDVFDKLESGSIDGFETMVFDERLDALGDKFLTITNHRFLSTVTFANAEFFDSLDENEQLILTSQLSELASEFSLGVVEEENRRMHVLEEHNVEILPANLESFKRLMHRDPKILSYFHEVSGSTGCTSSDQCKCRTNTYGTKCSCDKDCKENNDCKSQ